MPKMLFIDDKRRNYDSIAMFYKATDMQTLYANEGAEALQIAHSRQPDVIVLDYRFEPVNVAGSERPMQGDEILHHLQNDPSTKHIPVVMVSVQADTAEGYEALLPTLLRGGAVQVIPHAWRNTTLDSVVRSLLERRRPPNADETVIEADGHILRLGPGCREVWVDGKQKQPTPLDSQILEYLRQNLGRICTWNQLGDLWDPAGADIPTQEAVRRKIATLRKRVEPNPTEPTFVLTVRGQGCMLVAGGKRGDEDQQES